MAHISQVTFGRTINTGHYENYKICATVDLEPGENGAEAMQKLIVFIDGQITTVPERPGRVTFDSE